jgi:hypothetical protein
LLINKVESQEKNLEIFEIFTIYPYYNGQKWHEFTRSFGCFIKLHSISEIVRSHIGAPSEVSQKGLDSHLGIKDKNSKNNQTVQN